jgi:hypothetical protein
MTSSIRACAGCFFAWAIAVAPASALTVVNPTDLPDRPIGASPTVSESGPRITVNPRNGRKMLLVYLPPWDPAEACLVVRSQDGGRTWAPTGALPNLPGARCHLADVQWSSDGSRVYAATNAHFGNSEPASLLVSFSSDEGLTWSMTRAITGTSSLPSIAGVSLATPQGGSANVVYVATNQRVPTGTEQRVVVARSTDGGLSWGMPQTIDAVDYRIDGTQLSAPKIASGRGGRVALTWRANVSGWPTGVTANEIRFAASSDGGDSFEPIALVRREEQGAVGGPYELLPDLAIGGSGVSHIVYTHDPVAEGDDDIFYVWGRAPYTTWAAPIKVSDAPPGTGQEAPRIVLQSCGSTTVLHVMWWDTRLWSRPLRYDLFYSRKVALAGYGWSPDIRITGSPSPWGTGPADLAISPARVQAVWTDARDMRNPAIFDLDIFGSAIDSGVTCP